MGDPCLRSVGSSPVSRKRCLCVLHQVLPQASYTNLGISRLSAVELPESLNGVGKIAVLCLMNIPSY